MDPRSQPPAENPEEGNPTESEFVQASDLPAYDPRHLHASAHSLAYLEGPEPQSRGTQTSDTPETRPSRYFDGISQNAQTLGISRSDLLDSEATSPFSAGNVSTLNLSEIPESLQPSAIQQRFEHHPFFDCIPIPSLRDKTILACSTQPPLINRFDLCYDMFAGGLSFCDDAAMERNWQYSEQFKQKWQALLSIDVDALQRHVESIQ